MEGLKSILNTAEEVLGVYGLKVSGLHYFLTKPQQRFQRRCKGIAICIDTVTHNQNFFGGKYDNWRRIKLVDFAFQIVGAEIARLLPDHELYADIKVSLEMPFTWGEPGAFEGLKLSEGAVDVNEDNSVRFVGVAELLERGVLEPDCTLHQYCVQYELPHILQHGRHLISPDSSNVETFETICDTHKVRSVLEIGAGVGTCGVAAERRGIEDYTFVDLSPLVCSYLRSRFPDYRVVQANAFEFLLDRKWDVVLMGMPYELNPWFLAKRGGELAACTETVVFQSGCTAFFQLEHDWIFGRGGFSQWPWWKFTQTSRAYFQYVFELALDWQTCIVAGKSSELVVAVPEMHRRGFSPISYKYIQA